MTEHFHRLASASGRRHAQAAWPIARLATPVAPAARPDSGLAARPAPRVH